MEKNNRHYFQAGVVTLFSYWYLLGFHSKWHIVVKKIWKPLEQHCRWAKSAT